MTYQGWKNYETLCVKVWIDNDHGEYCYWQTQAQRACNEVGGEEDFDSSKACHILADELEQAISEDGVPGDGLTGVYADLLSNALSEVDWHEIATALVEEIEESEKEEHEKTLRTRAD